MKHTATAPPAYRSRRRGGRRFAMDYHCAAAASSSRLRAPLGRRATKKVTQNGTVTLHHRFLYRGYLQIDSPPPHRRLTPAGQHRSAGCPPGLTAVGRVACCDRKRANHPCIWLITWDPTQPIATRPLAIQKDGTWYTYGWDLTKNVWEVYGTTGYIGTGYTYTAYGQVSANGAVEQPIQWSSEYNDDELGLLYYNYRHYNPVDGRWIGRDVLDERDGEKIYVYCNIITRVALTQKKKRSKKLNNFVLKRHIEQLREKSYESYFILYHF